MSDKEKTRVVVRMAEGMTVAEKDGFLIIGYPFRGNDTYKIDLHEFLFAETDYEAIEAISDFLGIDQWQKVEPEGEPIGLKRPGDVPGA